MTIGKAQPRPGGRFAVALAALRREVTDGRFSDSDMLPGERDLSDTLSVSRTTLRRVLSTLVEEGVLTQRQGVGTFVHRGPPPDRPDRQRPWMGFSEEMRQRGFVASGREIERGLFRPTPEEAMMLASSPQADVVRVSRICFADDVPVMIEHAVVPADLLGGVVAIDLSLSVALETRGWRPVRSLQRIQAILLDDRNAARLHVPSGSAALLVSRTRYLSEGRCCEFTRSVYRSDRYDVISE